MILRIVLQDVRIKNYMGETEIIWNCLKCDIIIVVVVVVVVVVV